MPEPQDDPNIADNEQLLRRIRPRDIVLDSITNQYRPESGCFRSDDFISVHIASLTTVEAVLANYPEFSLARITAGQLRAIGCKVACDAQPDDPSHALVFGSAPGGFVSKMQAKKIVKVCEWAFLNTG